MTVALILLAVIAVMAVAPSREQLAREIADKNDRCGDVVMGGICLKKKSHTDGHEYESIKTTVPIE